jgi:hypothetical protein
MIEMNFNLKNKYYILIYNIPIFEMPSLQTITINSRDRDNGDINNFQYTLFREIKNVLQIIPYGITIPHSEPTINEYNNEFKFIHEGTTYIITIPMSFYDAETLGATLSEAMNTATTTTEYTVNIEEDFKYTILRSTGTFDILNCSSLYTLGFSTKSTLSGLGSYTGKTTFKLSTISYHISTPGLIKNMTYSKLGLKPILMKIDQNEVDGSLVLKNSQIAEKLEPTSSSIQTITIQVFNDQWKLAEISGDFEITFKVLIA